MAVLPLIVGQPLPAALLERHTLVSLLNPAHWCAMRASHLPTAISRPAVLMLAFLLALLALHVTGVLLDLAEAFHYRFELDYGEGIVWQQAALIPGPRMYAVRPGLPFIVFNYPPVYFLLAHLARGFAPDLLAAGRLVSALSAIAIGPLVPLHRGFDRLAPEAVRSGKGCFQAERCSGR